MANAKDARQWARTALHGIGNSLYTPFSGKDGDDIDWEAYRTLVRYCVGALGHPMLWVTSGLAEFWSLTTDERKKLLEIAVEEARALNPDVVVQACTTTSGFSARASSTATSSNFLRSSVVNDQNSASPLVTHSIGWPSAPTQYRTSVR